MRRCRRRRRRILFTYLVRALRARFGGTTATAKKTQKTQTTQQPENTTLSLRPTMGTVKITDTHVAETPAFVVSVLPLHGAATPSIIRSHSRWRDEIGGCECPVSVLTTLPPPPPRKAKNAGRPAEQPAPTRPDPSTPAAAAAAAKLPSQAYIH